MIDPEVTMSNVLTNTNLISHEKALKAAEAAITLAMRVPAPLKSIADQVLLQNCGPGTDDEATS